MCYQTWSTFFMQSLLIGEAALCLQPSKMSRNVHFFFAKEKDPIAIHIILAEDKVVETLHLLPSDCRKPPHFLSANQSQQIHH